MTSPTIPSADAFRIWVRECSRILSVSFYRIGRQSGMKPNFVDTFMKGDGGININNAAKIEMGVHAIGKEMCVPVPDFPRLGAG